MPHCMLSVGSIFLSFLFFLRNWKTVLEWLSRSASPQRCVRAGVSLPPHRRSALALIFRFGLFSYVS